MILGLGASTMEKSNSAARNRLIMKFHFLLANVLSLQLGAAAFAQDNLGQSDWQMPSGGDSNTGASADMGSGAAQQSPQQSWNAPATNDPPAAAQPQLGQSEWVNPDNQAQAPTAQVSDSCSYNSAPGLQGSVSQSNLNSGAQAGSQPLTTSPNASVVQKSNSQGTVEGAALNGIGSALGGLARGMAYSGMMSPYGMSPYGMMNPMGMGGMGMMNPMMNPMGMGGMGMMNPMMNPMGMGGMGMMNPMMGGAVNNSTASGAASAIGGAASAAGMVGSMLIQRSMYNSMLSHLYPRW